jgi:hypothetical protein
VTLEVVGQSSSSQKEGGDVRITGGDGLEIGGDVALVGGASTDTTPVEYGTISINANLDEASSSLTEIGSHSKTHSVELHGLISMNRKASEAFDNTTTVRISGGLFNVSAQRITLNNSAVAGSKLRVDSKDLRLGTMGTPSIRMGTLGRSDVAVQGSDLSLDASEDISIGAKASIVTIGKSRQEGQSVNVASGTEPVSCCETIGRTDEMKLTCCSHACMALQSQLRWTPPKGYPSTRRALMPRQQLAGWCYSGAIPPPSRSLRCRLRAMQCRWTLRQFALEQPV